MKKSIFYLALFLQVTIISSCTDADSAKAVSQGMGSDNTPILNNDSISQTNSGSESEALFTSEANGEKEEEEQNLQKKLNLTSTEQQLEYMEHSDNWGRYETGILPQMAQDVPSYCQKILESDGKRFIIVDKAKMKVFLYDPYGNVEKSYGMACAKNYGTKQKKGDSRTTEGIFEVKGVFDSTEWLFTDDNGYTSPKKGQYGPRFIRLNIPYIGIHGTGSPSSIGKRCSHGCIRVNNENILELVEYVETGMPVIISPGPKDMQVNEKEGSDIASVVTEPGTPRAEANKYIDYNNHKVKEEENKAEETTATTTSEDQNTGSEEEISSKSEDMNESENETHIEVINEVNSHEAVE